MKLKQTLGAMVAAFSLSCATPEQTEDEPFITKESNYFHSGPSIVTHKLSEGPRGEKMELAAVYDQEKRLLTLMDIVYQKDPAQHLEQQMLNTPWKLAREGTVQQGQFQGMQYLIREFGNARQIAIVNGATTIVGIDRGKDRSYELITIHLEEGTTHLPLGHVAEDFNEILDRTSRESP